VTIVILQNILFIYSTNEHLLALVIARGLLLVRLKGQICNACRCPSIRCPSRGYISKTKQDRPIAPINYGTLDTPLILLPHSYPPPDAVPGEIFWFQIKICWNITAYCLTRRQTTAVIDRSRLSSHPAGINCCQRSATVGTCW